MTTAASPVTTAAMSALASASLFLSVGCALGKGEAGTGPDLRSDHILVMFGLLGIDFPVVVGVEDSEEAIGVLLHLVGTDLAVMVAIGLPEPVSERVLAAHRGSERLAHRADEDAAKLMRAGWRRRSVRRRCGGKHKEQCGDGHGLGSLVEWNAGVFPGA
jgi:hypothetical protein